MGQVRTVILMPLRQSLLISIFLIIVFTLLLGSGVIYWHAVNKVETEMSAAMSVGGRIARNAVDDVEESANPKRRLELLVADFDGDRHLKAMVVDAASKPLLESRPAQPDDPAPMWFINLLMPEQRWLKVELPAAFSGLGKFVLESQPHNEIAEAWEDTKKTLFIMSVLCVLTMGLVYRVLGRALSPLAELSDAVSKIGSTSNPPKMRERGPQEFVRVYRGFNQMVDRLDEIEKANLALSQQLNTVQEEERSALARDLHDEIGPFLFAVDVDVKSIEADLDEKNRASVSDKTKRIRDSIAHMQRHLKDILGRLRSMEMLDMGLEHALESLVTFWRRRHPDIRFTSRITENTYGESLDAVFYRIAQESLSNAIRHGAPSEITVCTSILHDEIARLEVIDDGKGFSSAARPKTYGISGMQERIRLVGGTLKVENRRDQSGVHIIAEAPLDPKLAKTVEYRAS